MKVDEREVLKESLKEVKGGGRAPEPPRQDYMELGATYFCRGEEGELERCKRFSPTATGSCTFRDGEFCKWEQRV